VYCIIAGSRDITNYITVLEAINHSGFEIDTVVSGGARGVDDLGVRWAEENNKNYIVFPAKWGKHGKGAGHVRNREMAEYADALIAVWDGKSRGTANMIKEAEKRNLEIYIHHVDE
jgi:hypothetical protein